MHDTEWCFCTTAPMKSSGSQFFFCNNWCCFGVELTSMYFSISCQMKEFFLSQTTCRKYFLVTGSNILALQVINCHKKKFLVTGRNFLSEPEMSCHRKKFLCIRRNFLLQKESSFCRKEFPATVTTILNAFCHVWLLLFRAKFLAESIGIHKAKYFIPPWSSDTCHT